MVVKFTLALFATATLWLAWTVFGLWGAVFVFILLSFGCD